MKTLSWTALYKQNIITENNLVWMVEGHDVIAYFACIINVIKHVSEFDFYTFFI
jgi:hypothetical protein